MLSLQKTNCMSCTASRRHTSPAGYGRFNSICSPRGTSAMNPLTMSSAVRILPAASFRSRPELVCMAKKKASVGLPDEIQDNTTWRQMCGNWPYYCNKDGQIFSVTAKRMMNGVKQTGPEAPVSAILTAGSGARFKVYVKDVVAYTWLPEKKREGWVYDVDNGYTDPGNSSMQIVCQDGDQDNVAVSNLKLAPITPEQRAILARGYANRKDRLETGGDKARAIKPDNINDDAIWKTVFDDWSYAVNTKGDIYSYTHKRLLTSATQEKQDSDLTIALKNPDGVGLKVKVKDVVAYSWMPRSQRQDWLYDTKVGFVDASVSKNMISVVDGNKQNVALENLHFVPISDAAHTQALYKIRRARYEAFVSRRNAK